MTVRMTAPTKTRTTINPRVAYSNWSLLPRAVDSLITRREAITALASTAALPLMSRRIAPRSYAKQVDGELGRIQSARAAGFVPPAF